MRDIVDDHMEEWRRERPDLDTSGLQIVNRICILGKLIGKRTRQVLKPLGLELWEYEVLAALRRSGEPFALPPTTLAKLSMLTTGAMTNRIDRLEERGLVQRKPHPEDRRGLHVALTPQGRKLVDHAVEVRVREAIGISSALSETDRLILGTLLKKLVLDI